MSVCACVCVCMSVCLCHFFDFFLKVLLLPFTKIESPIDQCQNTKLGKHIGLSFRNFSSKMLQNCWADFFGGVFATHFQGRTINLHGSTTELAWMHNGICMDEQWHLHGCTTEFAWTNNRQSVAVDVGVSDM